MGDYNPGERRLSCPKGHIFRVFLPKLGKKQAEFCPDGQMINSQWSNYTNHENI
jgi:hypothetical protein